MNYYPFHPGDYSIHTAHLSDFEDLAYRRLLDLYYTREEPLPDNITQIARLIRLREHEKDIETVLREFFSYSAGEGWLHSRCESEIAKFRDKTAKAKTSARASVEARQANAQRTLNERQTEAELTKTITITKTKGLNTRTSASAAITPPDGVSKPVWDDFCAHRKAKRAPITDTAIAGIQREALKAGWQIEDALRECCTRGWVGFKADWIDRDSKRTAAGPVSFKQANDAQAIERWEQQTGRQHPSRSPSIPSKVIDITPIDASAQRTLTDRSTPKEKRA